MRQLKSIEVSGRKVKLKIMHDEYTFDILDFYNFMYLCTTSDSALPKKPNLHYRDAFPDTVYSLKHHGEFSPILVNGDSSSSNRPIFKLDKNGNFNATYSNDFYSELANTNFFGTGGKSIFELLIKQRGELKNCLSLIHALSLPKALLESLKSDALTQYLDLNQYSLGLNSQRQRMFVGNLVYFALFRQFKKINSASKAPSDALSFILNNRYSGFVTLYKSEYRNHMSSTFFNKLFARMIQNEEDAVVLLKQIPSATLTRQFFRHFAKNKLSLEKFLERAQNTLHINELVDFVAKLSRYDARCFDVFNTWLTYERVKKIYNNNGINGINRMQSLSGHPDIGQWIISQIKNSTTLYRMLSDIKLQPTQIQPIIESIYEEGFKATDRLIIFLWLKHYQNQPSSTMEYLFLEDIKALAIRINSLDSVLLDDFIELYAGNIHTFVSDMFLDTKQDLDGQFLSLLKRHRYHFSQESLEALFKDCHVSLDKLNYLEPRISSFRKALGLGKSFEKDIKQLLLRRRAELRQPKTSVDALLDFGVFSLPSVPRVDPADEQNHTKELTGLLEDLNFENRELVILS